MDAAVCLAGIAAALLALASGPAVLRAGPVGAPSVAVDGLSAILVAAWLLVAACDRARPAATACVALALLAGDAATLWLAVAGAVGLTRAGRGGAGPLPVPVPVLGLVALGATLALLAGPSLPDPSFAAIRAATGIEPPGPVHAALLLPGALLAAGLLGATLAGVMGGVVALGLVARLLLDLPGRTTPGWWAVPLLCAAVAAALFHARRAGGSDALRAVAGAAGAAMLALAAAALGAALLARAADLLPAAALAVAAALLLVLAATASTAVLLRAAAATEAGAGTSSLVRLGGVLPRAPLVGTAMLMALASVAALPLTVGFAAPWLLVQALLVHAVPGSARLAGTAILALVAASLAAAGLVQALLAAAAFRVAGAVLLGVPRTAQAAAMAEPRRAHRVGIAALAVVGLVAGLCPFLPLALVQPAVRALAGAGMEAAGPWLLAPLAEAPGYAAPALAVLVGLAILAAGRLAAAAPDHARVATVADPWRGGLGDEPASRAVVPPPLPWPGWGRLMHTWSDVLGARHVLLGLALALAACLGWAAR